MHEQEAAAGRVGSDCGVVEGHGDDCECFCTPSRFAARREPVPDQAGEQRDQLRSCASHPRAVSGLRAFEALTGEGEAGSGIGATVALPFCGDVWTLESPASGCNKRLVISSWAACGAEVAVACPDGVPGTGLRSPILLLRRCDPAGPLLYGNLYLVELAGMRLLRTVDAGGDDGTLRLSREGCGDTLVDRAAVASLWLVCAAIDRLVR